MPNELTKVESALPVESTYDRVLELAIQKESPMDQLQKFLELKYQHEEREAKKAFVSAMASFKAEPPEILKTKHVFYKLKDNKGVVDYWHADLGVICDDICKALSKYDLFSSWKIEQPDKSTVRVTCIITHGLGYSDSVTMEGPPDTSGGKDALKAVASTSTTLQRLTLLAATGLSAKGMDVDGGKQEEPIEYISTDQAIEVSDMLDELYSGNPNAEKLIADWFSLITLKSGIEIKDAEHIPVSEYKGILDAIKTAKSKIKK
jgi:hypothetical protein